MEIMLLHIVLKIFPEQCTFNSATANKNTGNANT